MAHEEERLLVHLDLLPYAVRDGGPRHALDTTATSFKRTCSLELPTQAQLICIHLGKLFRGRILILKVPLELIV